MLPREPYSFRADPAIPRFDDARPLALVDGECALCSRSARLICRLDRRAEFRIAAVQSPLGRALCTHYGLDADDPTSWLYIENGRAYGALDAVVRAGRRLGGLGLLAAPLGWLPRGMRDALYRFVATRRIAWFGRADLCALPDPELRRRLLL
jgi:predicted DCC family thiol-disulfide oxidoreductase YuxK